MSVNEDSVEQAAIAWLKELGYSYAHGSDIAHDGVAPERDGYGDVILVDRLRGALASINDHLPSDALDDVLRRITRAQSPSTEENNHVFQQWLSRGMEVQVRRDGAVRGDLAWLIDFEHPERNDWFVVNQFTVIEGKHNRRPDLVVFVNGLPLAVIELKNPEDANATMKGAWNQLQTYRSQIGSLFNTNEVMVISDGLEAKVGSLTAPFERFGPWRTVDGVELAPAAAPKLKVLLEGLFDRRRFLDYVRNFVLWETDDGYIKKIAGYHQYHAANKAVEATVRAAGEGGDKRIGVVWHTQGSGKSISMVFYAGKIVVRPEMQNPTLVVLTDRNDLDGQLFAQFAAARGLIHKPEQAESRDHLRELLTVASGGVIFTTIQKFGTPKGESMPTLCDRRNVVVMADEAHRSQYEFVEGFARNVRDALPNASFIGFTGTPIEFDDRSTAAVFGEYIDTYTIAQSVEDKATVPIHYEARLAKIDLPEAEKPRVDQEVEEVTEGEELGETEKLKRTWSKLEALVGSEKRLALVAEDIVAHWDRRAEVLSGKAMIVCMSRRICVDLYAEIIKLRSQWHHDDVEKGCLKVVMTAAASDPQNFQPHHLNKIDKKIVEKRFKNPDDPLELVIVRDMWLTGFDVPCLHSLYLDKPMKGHTLMQAIARVNRVFKDKPSGLVVDYLGIADQLRKAIGTYGGRRGEPPGVPIEEALRVLQEKFEVVGSMFHGFDHSAYFTGDHGPRVEALSGGLAHIVALPEGKERYLDAMAALNKAAGIALHLEEARHMRDDIGYYQAVQSNMRKHTITGGGRDPEELSAAIRQIVSGAITSEGVIDIFGVAGIKTPDISILSDEFLESVKQSPHKNLQVELLRKLLNDEIRAQTRQNVVQARKFSELLSATILRYQNRTLEAAEVILELIDMAKQLRDAPQRGEALGLTDDELAFYDALAAHGEVREVMGDDVLAGIAHDLVEVIRQSVTIDWTQKEAVRAKMRTRVRRLLRKYGYPPDKRQEAVVTVIEQAEAVCREWGEAA